MEQQVTYTTGRKVTQSRISGTDPGVSARKKSAAEQLEESKNLYVKSSSVREKRHNWTLFGTSPQRECVSFSANAGLVLPSAENTTPHLPKAAPPVPPRKSKMSPPPPLPKSRPDKERETVTIACSPKTKKLMETTLESAYNADGASSKSSTADKLINILTPTSKHSEKSCRKNPGDDFKNRLISLLNYSDCSAPASPENIPEVKSILKRSQSLNRSSQSLFKEGWALNPEKKGHLALLPASSRTPENLTSFPSSTLSLRQKSMPSLKDPSSEETEIPRHLEEDCSTVRADIDSESTSSSASDKGFCAASCGAQNQNAARQLSLTEKSVKTELQSFFDTMGLDCEVLKNMSSRDEVDSMDLRGSVTSLPSTYWSNSESQPSSEKETTANSGRPVSIIEKNARIIKWIYGFDKIK